MLMLYIHVHFTCTCFHLTVFSARPSLCLAATQSDACLERDCSSSRYCEGGGRRAINSGLLVSKSYTHTHIHIIIYIYKNKNIFEKMSEYVGFSPPPTYFLHIRCDQ